MTSASSSQPLRVIVVIPGKEEDHTMVFSRRQAKALTECHGAEVRVFFLESRMSPTGIAKARRKFKAMVRDFKPMVVHAHYGTVTALFSVLFSPLPVVVTYHGSDLNKTPNDGFVRDLMGRVLSQLAALGASGIICVSTQLRDALWWRKSLVRIIPMGVELRRYVPMERDAARARLGWDHRKSIVIFNASAPIIKRLDIALAVEKKLIADGVSMELEILRGTTTQEEMPILLSAADAILLCSDNEGSPTIVKEAMACNLPVVTSDVGDVRERLAGTSPGAIVDQSVDHLASALRTVLASGKRSNGRVMAVQNRADAETLDRETYELLLRCARHGSQ